MSTSVSHFAESLTEQAPTPHLRSFDFGGCRIDVAFSEADLADWVADYYTAFDSSRHSAPADFTVRVHQVDAGFDTGLQYVEWKREPGKSLGKEAFFDLADGRVVHKVRTGMQFLVSGDLLAAFGDCRANPNQIVNFINFQLTSWLMNREYALCHAAGIVQNGRGLAMASYSGGGKSTLALHLISRGADFASNDRVLAKHEAGGHTMVGVPKHPRINPGTVLGNEDLHSILEPARLGQIREMPLEELWTLEEKYDARIDHLFGENRIQMRAPLMGLLILAWTPGGTDACKIEPVSLEDEPDWLDAIVKSPGPFYQPDQGPAPTGYSPPDTQPYLDALRGLPTFVARGGANFDTAIEFCRNLLRVGRGQGREA